MNNISPFLKSLFLLSWTLFMLSACETKTNVIEPKKFDDDYYPLHAGQSITYDVDSIVYDDFTQTVDTYNYQITDVIVSAFTDGAGKQAYRVERRYQENDTSEIKKVQEFYVDNAQSNIQMTIDNRRYLKISYPAKEGKSWDGNLYNSLDEQEYTFKDVGKGNNINGHLFDETVTVVELDKENLIEKDYVAAVYARHTGLVYWVDNNLNYKGSEIPDPSLPWEERANQGYIVKYKFKSFVPGMDE